MSMKTCYNINKLNRRRDHHWAWSVWSSLNMIGLILTQHDLSDHNWAWSAWSSLNMICLIITQHDLSDHHSTWSVWSALNMICLIINMHYYYWMCVLTRHFSWMQNYTMQTMNRGCIIEYDEQNHHCVYALYDHISQISMITTKHDLSDHHSLWSAWWCSDENMIVHAVLIEFRLIGRCTHNVSVRLWTVDASDFIVYFDVEQSIYNIEICQTRHPIPSCKIRYHKTR